MKMRGLLNHVFKPKTETAQKYSEEPVFIGETCRPISSLTLLNAERQAGKL